MANNGSTIDNRVYRLTPNAAGSYVNGTWTTLAAMHETRLYYVFALRGRSTTQISNRLVQTYLRRGVNPDLMKAAAIRVA